MLKKLKNMLYNIKKKQILDNVEFDSFGFLLDYPYPVFGTTNEEGQIVTVEPKTIEILKQCVSKLTSSYVQNTTRIDFKHKLKSCFEYFGFELKEFENCMMMFDAKRKEASNLTTLNAN